MKRTLASWLPMIFCAFLVTMPVIGLTVYPGSWWQPAFYCFLPMCFLYSGAAHRESFREIDELRARLAALEARQAA